MQAITTTIYASKKESRSKREITDKIYGASWIYAYVHSLKQESPPHLLWKLTIPFSLISREEILNMGLIQWPLNQMLYYK